MKLIEYILAEATSDEIYQKYYSDIPEDIFNQIISIDIVSTDIEKKRLGEYGKWLLSIYKKGELKLEDLYKAKEYLPVFDKLKKSKKLENPDINKYKNLGSIFNVIKDVINRPISGREKIKEVKKDAEKFYEDDTWIVIIPKTEEASCYYGKGTEWCTAATKSENRFK